jgi:hypothetical protein
MPVTGRRDNVIVNAAQHSAIALNVRAKLTFPPTVIAALTLRANLRWKLANARPAHTQPMGAIVAKDLCRLQCGWASR